MANSSWYCGGIFYKIEDRKCFILVVPYIDKHRNNQRQIRLPGGSSNGDIDIEDTLIREMMEETGLVPCEYNLIYENIKSPEHTQYFFLIKEYSGEMLCFEGLNPIDPETEQPEWVDAYELEKTIFHTHKIAFKMAINQIACESSKDFEILQNLLLLIEK